MAESAYYRLVFWNSMTGAPIKKQIKSEHSLFSVDYQSQMGIRLQSSPFNKYQTEIAHPSQYNQSQQLGSAMRGSAVDVFEYPSARDPQKGDCVGLFTVHGLKQKRPTDMSHWLCETNTNEMLFKQLDFNTIIRFKLEIFLTDGKLPIPA